MFTPLGARRRRRARATAIALVMRNRPDYFALWLGLTQIGAVAALVSPDLAPAALAHALKVSGATRSDRRRAILLKPCMTAPAGSRAPLELWTHKGARADMALRSTARSRGPVRRAARRSEARAVTLDDQALRIFTSGTTGLPKAAEVSHRRIVVWTHWFAGLAGLTPGGSPSTIACRCTIASAASSRSARRWSTAARSSSRSVFRRSRFLDDVARLECTSFQYIGELCRYLVAAPPRDGEKAQKLRLALGNGLAADVWRAMLDRFRALRVLEFYASTEGNVWLYNVEGRIGAIGRQPPYLAARDPLALARFDADARGAVARCPDGLCERCEDGEVGEALGRIGGEASQRFEGYSEAKRDGKEDPARRIRARRRLDAHRRPDAPRRRGFLLFRRPASATRFAGRARTSRRGKSLMCARRRLALRRRSCLASRFPGAEGRAGMAVLKATNGLDLRAFATGMASLPRYARPLFLRLVSAIATTETHKPKRGLYAAEGFDPRRISDPLFLYDAEREVFSALDVERYLAIVEGRSRL